MNDKKDKTSLDEMVDVLSAVMEHANQDEHIPECPFYRGKDKGDGDKVSSGAVSNAYRSGWDATFGRMQVGQA